MKPEDLEEPIDMEPAQGKEAQTEVKANETPAADQEEKRDNQPTERKLFHFIKHSTT